MSWPVTGAKRARSNEASEEDDDEKGEEDAAAPFTEQHDDDIMKEEEGGSRGSDGSYRPETAADAWPSSSVEEALDGYEPISRACILLRGLEALPIKQLRLIGHDLQKLADAAAASWIPGSQGSMGDGGPEVGGEVLEGGWGEAAQ
jgi:hypothetical protein